MFGKLCGSGFCAFKMRCTCYPRFVSSSASSYILSESSSTSTPQLGTGCPSEHDVERGHSQPLQACSPECLSQSWQYRYPLTRRLAPFVEGDFSRVDDFLYFTPRSALLVRPICNPEPVFHTQGPRGLPQHPAEVNLVVVLDPSSQGTDVLDRVTSSLARKFVIHVFTGQTHTYPLISPVIVRTYTIPSLRVMPSATSLPPRTKEVLMNHGVGHRAAHLSFQWTGNQCSRFIILSKYTIPHLLPAIRLQF